MINVLNKYDFELVENSVNLTISNNNAAHKNPSDSFTIIMPPPNVTGDLHIGHSLIFSIEDILFRYHKLWGKESIWRSGLDHAGIATQMVVERNLAKDGIYRDKIGRDQFINYVNTWKDQRADSIAHQSKSIGLSLDWSSHHYTMSDDFSSSVNIFFNDLYNNNLIYRDNRLVNWDCKLQTAISDLEVVSKEIERELYYIKYSIVDSDSSVIIATTRPETIYADSAIAIHPENQKLKHLIGKFALVPLIDKEIPIIADDYAEIDKGSGALKVTPAHDFKDFDCGVRHKLPFNSVINKNGTMNVPYYLDINGLTIVEARKKTVSILKNANLITDIEKTKTAIPFGDRSGTVVEPMLTKQWYVDAKKLSKNAMDAVDRGNIKFHPDGWKNTYNAWMRSIEPWCISRQLWWGHRIPAWYINESDEYIVALNEEEALKKAQISYGDAVKITQCSDVLDTWFSSALWPCGLSGWPKVKPDEIKPSDVVVTSFDIIFFWVARMVMASQFITNKVPFKNVYISPLIKDKNGEKMSKTKGNTIDPIEFSEKHGIDAFRFALIKKLHMGRSIKFSEADIDIGKKFITKIFNLFKFSSKYINNSEKLTIKEEDLKFTINQWMLVKTHQVEGLSKVHINNYRIDKFISLIYEFLWNDVCDWYLELIKPALNGKLGEEAQLETTVFLEFLMARVAYMLQPVTPVISQYVMDTLSGKENYIFESINSLNIKNTKEPKDVNLLILTIKTIRSIRGILEIPYSEAIEIQANNANYNEVLNKFSPILQGMTKSHYIIDSVDKNIKTTNIYIDGESSIVISSDFITKFLTEDKLQSLKKSLSKSEKEYNSLISRLSNDKFLEMAAQDAIDLAKSQAIDLKFYISNLKDILSSYAI